MPDLAPALSFPALATAEINLRRPDAANRLDAEDLRVLRAHCATLDARDDIHVVLVTAQGRTFCAGFDLGAFEGRRDDTANPGERPFEAAANALAALRAITIAVIDGPVVGGGTDLALACDLRIGSTKARMHMPAAKIGIPLYASALERYVTRLGLDAAKRLVLLGDTIEAEEMRRIGMLTELADSADAHARQIAATLANLPPKPLMAMKAVMNAAVRGPLSDQARAALHTAFDPVETARRIAALRAKR